VQKLKFIFLLIFFSPHLFLSHTESSLCEEIQVFDEQSRMLKSHELCSYVYIQAVQQIIHLESSEFRQLDQDKSLQVMRYDK